MLVLDAVKGSVGRGTFTLRVAFHCVFLCVFFCWNLSDGFLERDHPGRGWGWPCDMQCSFSAGRQPRAFPVNMSVPTRVVLAIKEGSGNEGFVGLGCVLY